MKRHLAHNQSVASRNALRPRTARFALYCAVAVLIGLALPANAVDQQDVIRQRQVQERARTMVTEMVAAVLDTQIQQLQENGLTHLPVYQDIEAMRSALAHLVSGEMLHVVTLLTQIQDETEENRTKVYTQARSSVRKIVASLLAERQRLTRRMQVNRMAAQIRQIIERQTQVREATLRLAEMASSEREQLVLRNALDQGDVTSLVEVLTANLTDSSSWGGETGRDCSAGLQLLRTTRVIDELRSASERLAKLDFAAAARHQFTTLKSLTLLIDRLQNVRGESTEDSDFALAKIRELLQRQSELQKQTKQMNSDQSPVEDLAERQVAIYKQIAEVEGRIPGKFKLESTLEDAKSASLSASEAILEERKDRALSEQTKIVAQLSKAEQALKSDLQSSDRVSSDQLESQLNQLRILQQQLVSMLQEQESTERDFDSDLRRAGQSEQQLARRIGQLREEIPVPPNVDARLSEAELQLTEVSKELLGPMPGTRKLLLNSIHRGTQSLVQTSEQLAAEMADMRRRQLGLRAGELSRASEVLERAAAAERDLAAMLDRDGRLDNAESTRSPRSNRASTSNREQAAIAKVVQSTANAVRSADSEVGQELMELVRDSDLKTLIEPTEHTRQLLKQAKKLEQAASALRTRAGDSARELSHVAQEQLANLGQVRDSFAEKMAGLSDDDSPDSSLAASLPAACLAVEEAMAHQARASGRAKLADAMQTQQVVARLAELQRQATYLATEYSRGKGTNPLEAISAQQAVADSASQNEERVATSARKQFKTLAEAAGDVGRQLMLGNLHKAKLSRESAVHILSLMDDAAQREAELAANSPAGEPDKGAQQLVGQQIQIAIQLCQTEAPQAPVTLQECLSVSTRTAELLNEEKATDVRPKQDEIQSKLEVALAQITLVIDQQLELRKRRLLQRTEKAADAIHETAPIAPDAAAAMRQAAELGGELADKLARGGEPNNKSAARMGNDETRARDRENAKSGYAEELKFREEQFAKNMERATADFNLRETKLRRDRALADSLAQLAQEQQAAREELARHAEMLSGPSQELDSEAEQEAAKGLDEAAKRFADALKEAGEEAAELSGQNEIANQALREALQDASKFSADPESLTQESETTTDDMPQTAKQSGKSADGKTSMKGEGHQEKSENDANANGDDQVAPDDLSGDLGTGLVPSSPEATARQIAGRDAMARAAQIEKGDNGGEATEKEQATAGQSKPSRGRPSTTSANGGSSVPGETAKNRSPTESDPNVRPQAATDSRSNKDGPAEPITLPKYASEPWFAKLPPALRSALESNSRRKPPRGYEERLKRYFQNAD